MSKEIENKNKREVDMTICYDTRKQEFKLLLMLR